MINFTLDKIQLRNVRCYGDDMMEMDFPTNNLTVFTGHVGAGKSTILKAVSMALYGEDGGAKGEKLSIDDMINEKNGKNLEIHLYFHSTVDNQSEETKYEIHLFHKHKKYNNKLVFVKDGRDISLESKTATYELIEKTLIPKNVYHNVYYFTQQCKNFFTALPNTEQKEIFNAILDLSEYKSYYENVKKSLEDVEILLASSKGGLKTHQDNVIVFRGVHDNAFKNYEEAKKRVADRQQELYELIEDLQLEHDKLYSTVYNTDIDKRINDLNIEIQKFKSTMTNKIDNFRLEQKRLKSDLSDVIVPNLKNKYVKIRLERNKDIDEKINDLILYIQKNNSEMDKIKNDMELLQINDIQRLRDEYADKIKKLDDEKIQLTNNQNNLKNDLIVKLGELKDRIQKQVNELKEKNIQLQSYIDNTNRVMLECSDKIDDCKTKIDDYRYSLEEPDAVCSLCGQKLHNKGHLKKHIDDLERQIKEHENNKIVLKDKIKNYENDLTNNRNEIYKLQNEFETEKENLNKKYLEEHGLITNKINVVYKSTSDINSEFDNRKKSIVEQYTKLIETKTESIKNEINKFTTQKESFENQKKMMDDELRVQYKDEYNKIKTECDNKYEEIESTIFECEDQLSRYCHENDEKLKNLQNEKNNVEKIMDDVRSMKNSIEKYNDELKSYEDGSYFEEQLAAIKEGQKWLEDALAKANSYSEKVKDIERQKTILEFWKSAFSDSGIKSMLIDSAIPHMNECVMEELNRVAPGKFTVSFDTLSETKTGKIRDKFSINIINNDRGSSGHKKLSGGEKRIIDLCCMSALRSLAEKLYNKRFCHIFYDEILDSLDDECKQQFCINVKLQSQSGSNVTMVTHDLPEDVDPDRVFPF